VLRYTGALPLPVFRRPFGATPPEKDTTVRHDSDGLLKNPQLQTCPSYLPNSPHSLSFFATTSAIIAFLFHLLKKLFQKICEERRKLYIFAAFL